MISFSRRDFLASLFYASALVGLPAWARVGLKPPGQRKALVIGAGISGLFAASLLEKKGFTVEILEASDHVGGKLLGRKVGAHMFDLGGQALSLEKKRVKTLGKRLGMTLVPRPKQTEFFMRDGKMISGKKVAGYRKEINEVQNSIVKYFARLDDPSERKKHGMLSVDTWLRTQKLSAEADLMFRSTFCAEWCDSPSNISFLHYLDFSRSNIGEEGEMDFRYREGFFGMAEDEELLYTFCDELHRTQGISDTTYARAVKTFGEQGVVDILGISGYYTMLAMVLNTARTPVPAGHTPALRAFPR